METGYGDNFVSIFSSLYQNECEEISKIPTMISFKAIKSFFSYNLFWTAEIKNGVSSIRLNSFMSPYNKT